jgi:hypothetical protein
MSDYCVDQGLCRSEGGCVDRDGLASAFPPERSLQLTHSPVKGLWRGLLPVDTGEILSGLCFTLENPSGL